MNGIPHCVKFDVYTISHFSGARPQDLAGSSEVSGLALELLAAQVGMGSGGFLHPLLVPPWLLASQHFI